MEAHLMRKIILALGGASLVILVLAGGALAAGPRATPPGGQGAAQDTIPTVLGLSRAQVMDLRHDGLSLAQIAERQTVEPQALVAALQDRWVERIDARVANGAITSDTAATLKAQVELRARDMVYKVTAGGMQGVAVGAGPAGSGRRTAGSTGPGTCDGSGPHGAGRQ
jgi:hypothetical protein